MIDPHIQKAMECYDEGIAMRWPPPASMPKDAYLKYMNGLVDNRIALESHLLALVERVRKETIEEMGKK